MNYQPDKTRQLWFGLTIALGLGLFLVVNLISKNVFAQGEQIDAYESNLGVPVELNQSSTNYQLDSILDVVGGDSTSSTGLNVMHGYHLLEESEGLSITKVLAVPEKRYPATANNSTYFLLEILPPNSTYSSELVLWSSAGLIAQGENHQTDVHGVWTGTYEVGDLDPGFYDVYLTGYSHLRKKITNVELAKTNNELVFTYDEDTIESLKTAGTLSDTDPLYPLFAGNAAVASDEDDSCGPNIADCITGGSFSGDEWGDSEINSLDMSSVLRKLYNRTPVEIMKEDQDMTGEINSLDLSITLNNLYRAGDK